MTTPSFDVVQYDPVVYNTATHEEAIRIRDSLPQWIKERLVQRQTQMATFVYGINDDCIYVESADKEVQQALDELLHIHTRRDYSKRWYAEIPKAELDRFPFHYLSPRPYEQERQVFFEFSRPTCKTWEPCPWGYERTSPVRLHPKVLSSLGIGSIGAAWNAEADSLLLSADVKRLFDENGITGLAYEPCEVGTKKQKDDSLGTVAYAARIQPRTYLSADEVSLDNYCPEHQMLGSHRSFNERLPYSRLGSEDFHAIDRIRVGEKEYWLQTRDWVASSRVVKLLLREKVKGLMVCTAVLKEKFRPLVNLEEE